MEKVMARTEQKFIIDLGSDTNLLKHLGIGN
jgi:hypothetical protein